MNCEDIRDLLPLFAGGETADNERLAVEAHLSMCLECGRELEEYREARRMLSDLREVPMPAGAEASMWRNVREDLFPRRRVERRLDWTIRYAAILIIGLALGFGVVSLTSRKSPSQIQARVSPVESTPSVAGGERFPADFVGSNPDSSLRNWVFSDERNRRPFLPRASSPDGNHHLPRVEALLASGEREF